MNVILAVILVLIISRLFVLIGKKIKIPNVVSLIFAGLFLGIPFVRDFVVGSHTEFIFYVGDIALLSLMFLAGLESSWREIIKEKRDSIFIALFAFMVPFLLGTGVFLLLGFSLITSFMVGLALSITAEATKARVLLGLGKLKTRVGSAMMGAGIIDDLLGLGLFIFITFSLNVGNISENILIVSAILAFFIGIIMQKTLGRIHTCTRFCENSILWLVVPFFFISMGLHFDFTKLVVSSNLLLIIIALAFAGKMLGVFLTKPFTNFSWKQLHIIGWGMNSRGAIELALALLALRIGIIDSALYSSLVVMAIVTTLSFPVVMTHLIKKYPKIMD